MVWRTNTATSPWTVAVYERFRAIVFGVIQILLGHKTVEEEICNTVVVGLGLEI
ncbi:hypothetical protein P152DRAFT_460305 [Eremomyces bilateralis CBS 781.70]|uniref:Uncharacterized protein n=1 Tax=Eremomyces bilateralis CBS 781.70 TaxID=1392243 RepID=A0A6G1FXX3_9PEZI|nr:uncharacterized protein P152DRAFT_460305 [Eremomyces bilateralis CBS 781.70]KAF1810608.1 hypothetical protein P152DRAFT_460305 [Eremomyces bilateralis CBS 781.70]